MFESRLNECTTNATRARSVYWSDEDRRRAFSILTRSISSGSTFVTGTRLSSMGVHMGDVGNFEQDRSRQARAVMDEAIAPGQQQVVHDGFLTVSSGAIAIGGNVGRHDPPGRTLARDGPRFVAETIAGQHSITERALDEVRRRLRIRGEKDHRVWMCLQQPFDVFDVLRETQRPLPVRADLLVRDRVCPANMDADHEAPIHVLAEKSIRGVLHVRPGTNEVANDAARCPSDAIRGIIDEIRDRQRLPSQVGVDAEMRGDKRRVVDEIANFESGWGSGGNDRPHTFRYA